MDGFDDGIDAPYLTATHVPRGPVDRPIPVRTFYVVLGAALLLGVPVATQGRRELGAAAVCGWVCCPCCWPRR